MNEVMSDDELVKDVNPILLKERSVKDVEGDESTLLRKKNLLQHKMKV